MGEGIKGLFFTDKFRSVVTIILLLLILGSIITSWAFPRREAPTIDKETVLTLKKVSVQLQRAVDNFEKQGKETAELTNALTQQLYRMETSRDDNYKLLLEKYGIKVPDSFKEPANPTGSDAAPVNSNDQWLRSEGNYQYSRSLPGDAGAKGGDSRLPKTIADHAHQFDGSRATPAGYKPSDTN